MKYLKNKSLSVLKYLTFLVGVSFSVSSTFACTIESGMPADLKTYLSDLEAAQGKIASEAGRGSCSTTGKTSGVRVSENISLAAGEIRGSINRALTQDSFGAVTETFRRIGGGELPRAVRDQLNTLLRTQESIGRSIELVYGQCASGRAVNPREILGNLAQDGASENATLGDTTSELMTRHVALTVAYREAVNATPFSENSLKYVPEKLRASLTQNYGLSAIESCTKKWDAWKQVVEKIQKYSTGVNSIAESVEDMKSADSKTESEKEVASRKEGEELATKMEKKGFLWKISSINLRSSENGNTSESQNGLAGFAEWVGLRVAGAFEEIKKSFDPLEEDLKKSETTDEWITKYKNIQTLQSNLALEILSDYRGLMDQIGDEQVSKDIYEGKFARIYIELERGTRLLDADREIAQETCKQQTTNETGSACDQPKSNY